MRGTRLLLGLLGLTTVGFTLGFGGPAAAQELAVLVPEAAPHAAPPLTDVQVLFESDPLGAKVTLDGESLCTTPCRKPLEPGVHYVSMQHENYITRGERLTLSVNSVVSFKLTERPYHFLLMNDLSDFGSVIITAFDPTDTKYRFLTVFDGMHFLGLSPGIDVGMGGAVFSYHHGPQGSSWSIFGFGPSLRFGRLIASSHIELLSFRHRAPAAIAEGWRPGLTSKLQLPLLTSREARGWASLFPVPTVGVDIWADKELGHDETAFWVGLAWLPGTSF